MRGCWGEARCVRDWLDARYPNRGTTSSRFSEAVRVEAAYGDLEAHYARDRLVRLIGDLDYSMADERSGKPNPTSIAIDGNVRNGLASLRSAVRCYQRFSADGN